MNASLLALNIIVQSNTGQRILLNKTDVPTLYYWNGTDNLEKDFLSNEVFRTLIDETCFNKDSYSKSKIAYFNFTLIDNEENYNEYSIDIQDLFTLDLLTETENMFYIEYLNEIMNNLYITSMGHEFNGNILLDTNEKYIQMYLDIQKKYPNRFVKNTLLNYVRSELVKLYDLHQVNSNWIINKLEEILKEQN